jgi:hypothetical protein
MLIRRNLLRYIIVGAFSFLAVAGCGEGDGTSTKLDRVRTFSGYPVYWLGERFERWELSAIYGPYRSGGTIIFIYGTCTPRDGGEPSCAPPIDLQVTPLCRHLATIAANDIWRRRRIRGAPVGTSDRAPVLFSRRAQVKVYTGVQDAGLGLRALRALRSANRVSPVIGPEEAIPPAPATVLEGSRKCF